MEYAIAIFVGVWIASAGLLAYRQISSDFKEAEKEQKEKREGDKK